ncbi:MAG TPA: hypothetical protein VKY62_15700 [Devosia sp.]|nr:hypothetical protein [Devosia sp.]
MTTVSKIFAYAALIASLVLVFSVTSHAQDRSLTNVSENSTGDGGIFNRFYVN